MGGDGVYQELSGLPEAAMAKFPDLRAGKNLQYCIEDIGRGAFAVFFCQSPLFLSLAVNGEIMKQHRPEDWTPGGENVTAVLDFEKLFVHGKKDPQQKRIAVLGRERQQIMAIATWGDCRGLAPSQIVAMLAEGRIYVASESSFCRV